MVTSIHGKLAEKPVSFEGTEIVLNEIISAEFPLAKLLPLGGLKERKETENFRFQSPADKSSVREEHIVIRLTVRRHSNSIPKVS